MNPDSSVSTPHRLPEQRRQAGRHDLGEQGRAGLADDERRDDGRQQPHAVEQVLEPARGRRWPTTGPPATTERDAEGDADDGGDDDVAGPPAQVGGRRRGWASGGWWSRSTPRMHGRRHRDTGTASIGVDRPTVGSIGPASFAGTNRIRFRGSVAGPHSQRSKRSPEASSIVPAVYTGRRRARPQPADDGRRRSRALRARCGARGGGPG